MTTWYKVAPLPSSLPNGLGDTGALWGGQARRDRPKHPRPSRGSRELGPRWLRSSFNWGFYTEAGSVLLTPGSLSLPASGRGYTRLAAQRARHPHEHVPSLTGPRPALRSPPAAEYRRAAASRPAPPAPPLPRRLALQPQSPPRAASSAAPESTASPRRRQQNSHTEAAAGAAILAEAPRAARGQVTSCSLKGQRRRPAGIWVGAVCSSGPLSTALTLGRLFAHLRGSRSVVAWSGPPGPRRQVPREVRPEGRRMAGRARVGLAARGVHERLWSGTGTRGCEERAAVRESGRRVPGRCSLGGRLCCPQPLLFIQVWSLPFYCLK